MVLGTYELDTKVNVEGIQNGVSKIQSLFDKIDLPFEQKGALTKNFQELTRELTKYQTQIAKGFTTKNDLSNLEKSGAKINNLFDTLSKRLDKINLNKIHFDVENPQELQDAIKGLEDLKKASKQEVKVLGLDKIQNSINKISSSIGGDTKKKLQEAFNSGNVEEFNANLVKMAGLIQNAAKESGTLKQYAEQVRVAFKSGDMSQLEKAVTNIRELGTEVDGIKTEPLKKFAEGLLEIKQNSKDIGKIEGLSELGAKISEAEVKVKQLSDAYQAKLVASAGNARVAIKSLATEMVQTENELQRTAQASQSMAQSFDQIKTRLAYFFSAHSAIMLMRRAFQYTLSTVKELDAAMTQTAVVTNFNVGDMWSALPKYKDTANELGVSLKGVYETMTLFYQQGLQTDQVFQIGTETLKMARIAGMDYETATKAMTAALRGFNLELNEMSAQRVNDVYSKLAAITASDTGEIATAMEKTASIASNAGMELETTAAFLSQIIETTQEAPETAGTAMKTIIARFTEMKKAAQDVVNVDGEEISVNKVDAALKSVGVSLKNAKGEFRDLDDVFMELSSKWDSLDKMSQRYIATMAAGSRQQSRFIAMMSNYGRTMELVQEAQNAEGASDIQFEKTMDSMDAKINQLQTAWQSFLMGISNSSAIKGVVDMLTKVVNLFTKATTGTSGFVTAFSRISAVITIFKYLSASVKSLVANISQATLSWTTFKQGFNQNFNTSIIKQYQEEKNKKKEAEAQKIKDTEEAIGQIVGLEQGAVSTKENLYDQDVANFKKAQEEKVAAAQKATGEIVGAAQQGVTSTGAGAGVAAENISEQQNATQGMVIQPKAVEEIDLSDAEVKAFYNEDQNLKYFYGSKDYRSFTDGRNAVSQGFFDKTSPKPNEKNQVAQAKVFAQESIKQQRKLGIGAQNFQQLGLESGADVANPHKLRAQYAQYLPQYEQKDYESLVNQEFNGHLLGNEGKQIRARQMIADMNAVDVTEGRETFGSRMQAKRDALVAFNQSQSESSKQPEPEVPPQSEPIPTGNSGNEEKQRIAFKDTKGGQFIKEHAYAIGMAANLLGNGLSTLGDKMSETRGKTDGLVIGMQSAGAGLSMMGSTTGMLVSMLGPWGIAIAAVIGVITAAITAHQQHKKALEEEKKAAIEASKEASETAKKNKEAYKNLEETVKNYREGNATRSEVKEAADPLIESYDLQNEEAILLCGTYDELIEKMRELRAEEELQVAEKAVEARGKVNPNILNNSEVMSGAIATGSGITKEKNAERAEPYFDLADEVDRVTNGHAKMTVTGYEYQSGIDENGQAITDYLYDGYKITTDGHISSKELEQLQIVMQKINKQDQKETEQQKEEGALASSADGNYANSKAQFDAFNNNVNERLEQDQIVAKALYTAAEHKGYNSEVNQQVSTLDEYNKAKQQYISLLKSDSDIGTYSAGDLQRTTEMFFNQSGTGALLQSAIKNMEKFKENDEYNKYLNDTQKVSIIATLNPDDYNTIDELNNAIDKKILNNNLNMPELFDKSASGLLNKIASEEEIDENDIAAITTLLNQIDNQDLKNKWAEAQNQGYLEMLNTLQEIYKETQKIQKETFNKEFNKKLDEVSNPETRNWVKEQKIDVHNNKEIQKGLEQYLEENGLDLSSENEKSKRYAEHETALEEMAALNITEDEINNPVFGNINMNDRPKYINDDGSISTVLGTSTNYDGIEIAYSPMIERAEADGTKTATILTDKYIDAYMGALIDEIQTQNPNGWTTEDLLNLDKNGNGAGVGGKSLIADVGVTDEEVARVQRTAEIMHYLGEDGALDQAYQRVIETTNISADVFEKAQTTYEEGVKAGKDLEQILEGITDKDEKKAIEIIAKTEEYDKAVAAIRAEEIKKEVKIISPDELNTQAKLLKGYQTIEKKLKSVKENGYKVSGKEFAELYKYDHSIAGAIKEGKNGISNDGEVTFDPKKIAELEKKVQNSSKDLDQNLATNLDKSVAEIAKAEQQLTNLQTLIDNAKENANKDGSFKPVDEEAIAEALTALDSVSTKYLAMAAQAQNSFGEISTASATATANVTAGAAAQVDALNAVAQAAHNAAVQVASIGSTPVDIEKTKAVIVSDYHANMDAYNAQAAAQTETNEAKAANNQAVTEFNNDLIAFDGTTGEKRKELANKIVKQLPRMSIIAENPNLSDVKPATVPEAIKIAAEDQQTNVDTIETLGEEEDKNKSKGGGGGGGGGSSDTTPHKTKEAVDKENAQARLNTLKNKEADIDREIGLLSKLPIKLYPLEIALQGRKLANLGKQIKTQKQIVKSSEAALKNLQEQHKELKDYYEILEETDDFGRTRRTFQYTDKYKNASDEEKQKVDKGGLDDIKSATEDVNVEEDATKALMGDFAGVGMDMLNSGIDMMKQGIEKAVEIFAAVVSWWVNREDWLYNLLSKIEQETRNFARLQQVEERFRLGSTEGVDELVAAWYAQKESLDKQIALEEELIASRKAELQFLNITNLPFDPAFHYDYKEERVIENPWIYDAYKLAFAIGKTMPEIGQVFGSLEEWMENNKERMEKAVQDIEDAKDKILELEKEQLELRKQYMDDEVELEELVMDKIIEKMQEEVDALSKMNEAITEANSNLLDALQHNLEMMRQDRENANTEEDLAKKERKLAYLRQDTSGANQVEIRKLEDELEKGHQDYTDKLIDQKISELQRQNDEAAKQRERQINIAQSQLDYTERYGLHWEEAREMIQKGYDSQGRLRVGSELFDMLMSSADFAGLGAGSTRQYSQKFDWEITGIASAAFREINDVWNKGFSLNNIQTNDVHKYPEPKKYRHLPQWLNFLQPAYEELQDYLVEWTGANIKAFGHQLLDEETSPLAGRKLIGWAKKAFKYVTRDTTNNSNQGRISYSAQAAFNNSQAHGSYPSGGTEKTSTSTGNYYNTTYGAGNKNSAATQSVADSYLENIKESTQENSRNTSDIKQIITKTTSELIKLESQSIDNGATLGLNSSNTDFELTSTDDPIVTMDVSLYQAIERGNDLLTNINRNIKSSQSQNGISYYQTFDFKIEAPEGVDTEKLADLVCEKIVETSNGYNNVSGY